MPSSISLRRAAFHAALPICLYAAPFSTAHGQDWNRAIVKVESTLPNNRVNAGTGFFCDGDGTLVTAFHVIQGATSVELRSRYLDVADEVPELVAYDNVADLAKLRIRRSTPCLRLAAELPPDLSACQCEVIGHPWANLYYRFPVSFPANKPQLSQTFNGPGGNGADRYFDPDDIELLIIKTEVAPGMSGAPLIVEGKVIGVLSGGLGNAEDIGWAIPITRLASTVAPRRGQTIATLPRLKLLRQGLEFNARNVLQVAKTHAALVPYEKALARLSSAALAWEDEFLKFAKLQKDLQEHFEDEGALRSLKGQVDNLSPNALDRLDEDITTDVNTPLYDWIRDEISTLDDAEKGRLRPFASTLNRLVKRSEVSAERIKRFKKEREEARAKATQQCTQLLDKLTARPVQIETFKDPIIEVVRGLKNVALSRRALVTERLKYGSDMLQAAKILADAKGYD